MDNRQQRADEFIDGISPLTPNREVGQLFDAAFLDDPEVSSWARATLGIKLWGDRGKANRSVRVQSEAGVVQIRIDWWDCTTIDQILQMRAENIRQVRGNAKTSRDLGRVANAMRAFPGVTAGEAARLAGVKFEVLQLPDALASGE